MSGPDPFDYGVKVVIALILFFALLVLDSIRHDLDHMPAPVVCPASTSAAA